MAGNFILYTRSESSGANSSFPRAKRTGRGANHPPPSSTEVCACTVCHGEYWQWLQWLIVVTWEGNVHAKQDRKGGYDPGISSYTSPVFFKSLSKAENDHKQTFSWLRLYHVIHQFGRKISPFNTTFMNLALVAALLTSKNNKSRKKILEKTCGSLEQNHRKSREIKQTNKGKVKGVP